jgi:hypothetical protein
MTRRTFSSHVPRKQFFAERRERLAEGFALVRASKASQIQEWSL